MDSRRDRRRRNVEGADRLSNLPDDLIHKLLSFMSIKNVIETSCLSSRWKYIWTSMPYLNFSSEDFLTLSKFSSFVKHVLSGRNNQIEVFSLKLTFCGKVSPALVRRILQYAFDHNVQELKITCLHGKSSEFPLSFFSSQSLKNLTLTGCPRKHRVTTPPTAQLQALTSLNLHCVRLYDGLLSNCTNLKNLTLKDCVLMSGLNVLNIHHPGLCNLTLEDGFERVNLVAPQLKSLTINYWRQIHLISAPNLSSLHYKSFYCWYLDDGGVLQLATDLLHLEKVHVCIHRLFGIKANAHKIVGLLQQLRSAKFVTLNLELVKLLFSSMELISRQPSPFVDLKSLKIYPADVTEPKVTMSTEVKNYLLNNSPGATFTMVSYEEVIAMKNVTTT